MTRKRTRPYTSTIRVATDRRTRDAWASNLRAMRLERGLTQLALAERVGCTRAAVSAWECGVTSPLPETRKLIAAALRTSVVRVFPAAAA